MQSRARVGRGPAVRLGVQTPAPGGLRPVNRDRQIAAVAWKGGGRSPKVFCVRAWLPDVLALFSELDLEPNITTTRRIGQVQHPEASTDHAGVS